MPRKQLRNGQWRLEPVTLARELSGRLMRAILEGIYERSAPAEPYSPDAESAGKRALRQACLSLLAAGKSRFGIAKVKEQGRTATNMTEAMGALSEQSDNKKFQLILAGIRQKVNEGGSLADAMAVHPKVVPELYTNMVRSGETAGNLDAVLARLAPAPK